MNARSTGQVWEAAELERVRGYDRARQVMAYHINRLHRRAKKYSKSESPADEERYYRALKTLAYCMQVYVGAQRARFEEETNLADEFLKEFYGFRNELDRLRKLEAEYLKVVGGQR